MKAISSRSSAVYSIRAIMCSDIKQTVTCIDNTEITVNKNQPVDMINQITNIRGIGSKTRKLYAKDLKIMKFLNFYTLKGTTKGKVT